MNRSFFLYALCIFALASCSKFSANAAPSATVEAVHSEEAQPATTSAPTVASNVVAYDLIRAVIHNPKILQRKWSEMSQLFPRCSLPSNERDLQCPALSGVKQISVQDGGAGVITIEVAKPVTCEGIYNIVKESFGAGRQGESKCYVEWNLSRWVKGGHASIFASPKDPTRVFFQMNLDQGP
ncbi:MAG: hypothetical protein Q7U28_19235 [Aquabacterium sp.]|nr:hypothetical protein [Aquabacterium sp.]